MQLARRYFDTYGVPRRYFQEKVSNYMSDISILSSLLCYLSYIIMRLDPR